MKIGMNRKLISTAIIFLLVVTLFIGLHQLTDHAESYLPHSFEISSPDHLSLTFKDAAEINANSANMGIKASASRTEPALVYSKFSNTGYESVNLCLTSDDYASAANLKILYGVYSLPNRYNPAIVIGDDLAIKLFMNENAVGQQVTVEDTEYTICGIFKSDDSLIGQLSSDGIPIAYATYSVVNGAENLYVQNLYLSGVNTEFTQNLLNELSLIIGRKFSAPRTADHNISLQVISQFEHFSFFLIGLEFSCIMVVLFIRNVKKAYSAYIIKNWVSMVFRCAICFGESILAAVMAYYTSFKIYLPPLWIPEDNLFDIKFYIERILETDQQKNTWGYNYNWNLTVNILTVSSLITFLLFIVTIILTFHVLGLLRKASHDSSRYLFSESTNKEDSVSSAL